MIDDDLADRAIDIFSPMAKRQISRDEAREMVANLTKFFQILAEVRDVPEVGHDASAGTAHVGERHGDASSSRTSQLSKKPPRQLVEHD